MIGVLLTDRDPESELTHLDFRWVKTPLVRIFCHTEACLSILCCLMIENRSTTVDIVGIDNLNQKITIAKTKATYEAREPDGDRTFVQRRDPFW